MRKPVAMTEASWIPYRLWPLANCAYACGQFGLLADCEADEVGRAGSTSALVPNVALYPWSRVVGPAMAERLKERPSE